ncbi:MAG: GNAT family N-acetyltransferase [Maricaulaceae bacterium]
MGEITVKITMQTELSPAERKAWMVMRAENPALYSPYFHIQYADMIAVLRPDTAVLVAYQDGMPLTFLPYQTPQGKIGGFAKPIGAPMTDYHGFIHSPHSDINFDDILKKSSMGAYHFAGLVSPETFSDNHIRSRNDAALMNLSQGAKAWRAAHDNSYRRSLKSLRRRIRNAETDIGTRRIQTRISDPAIFETLIDWKRQQFVDTGKYDVLSADWTRGLLKRLWQQDQSAGLRCDMHALYFGDHLAAIDFGLTDGSVYHSWIVAYDERLANYSPGIQLLEGLIDQSTELGYTHIDLGVGTDGYKRHYATDAIPVGSGYIALKGPAAALSNIYDAAEKFGQKALADIPGKMRRRYAQISACEDTASGRARAMLHAVTTSGRS